MGHDQDCRRVPGMQDTYRWMSYWSRCSIPNCSPKITTKPVQAKNEKILCKCQHAPLQASQANRPAERKYCVLDQSEESIQPSRSPWEIRYRQGPSIQVDKPGEASATTTMVATKSRYLPKGFAE